MISKHGILTVGAVALLAGCASDNLAQRNSYASRDTSGAEARDYPEVGASDKSRISGHISDADYAFIRDTEAGGLFELSAGQKAIDKSQDPLVKSLAQHLVEDHTKLNAELTNLASRKGMADTAGMTAAQVAMLARLDNVSGLDFDREYLNQQQIAHEDTIARFETASASADDKDLRNWASVSLPVLRNHLTMIQTQLHVSPTDAGNGAADNGTHADVKNSSNTNSGMNPPSSNSPQ